jgi:hypothetical protein
MSDDEFESKLKNAGYATTSAWRSVTKSPIASKTVVCASHYHMHPANASLMTLFARTGGRLNTRASP